MAIGIKSPAFGPVTGVRETMSGQFPRFESVKLRDTERPSATVSKSRVSMESFGIGAAAVPTRNTESRRDALNGEPCPLIEEVNIPMDSGLKVTCKRAVSSLLTRIGVPRSTLKGKEG